MSDDDTDPFWGLLAKAHKLEVDRILSSDEAFEEWLKKNPLTPEEEKLAQASVDRLRERLKKATDLDKKVRDSWHDPSCGCEGCVDA